MKVVIQRVSKASVLVDSNPISNIELGYLVLLGIEAEDSMDDVVWLSKKICNLRIFDDQEGNMNNNIAEVDGNILLVSQFTLHAKTKKGNRPSFIRAARPEFAIPLYEKMIIQLNEDLGKEIETGKFGAMMDLRLVNSGPVTIIIDSKNKD
ncbi:MAG: D-aminoacyl-tRNA deacylase [Flavobacteriales bacterium]|jgi:D-tyrosyl-tRNA(Tyr) deacylase|tara:strand:- start:415 stop:867 length:453 start_codon:yes stop_codon:yes gene_type:complete